MSHWSKWTTALEPEMATPPPWKQNQKLLGNYLQEGTEGSFLEIAKYQNLLDRPAAKTKVRKLPGNYLQQGAESSFQEVVQYRNLQKT